MTTLRTAAQQALEALMWHDETVRTRGDDEAIEALRAALEQHEKDVEWMKQRHANWRLQKELAEQTQERDRQQREYEETRSAELAQPEQAPVAWIQSNHLQLAQRGPFLCRVEPTQRHPDFVPLYTSPPRREWRGLSEQERHRLWRKLCEGEGLDEYAEAMRDAGYTRRPTIREISALEQPEQEPQCNPHPNAPHGFLRNASHTEGRYVCACEYWQPCEAAHEIKE